MLAKICRRLCYWGWVAGTLCALLAPASVWASRFDGGIPGSFLEFGSGARALGMGRAFGAIAEGPEALIWNPGGIGLPYRNGASFTRMSLFEGATLDELSFAHAFKRPIGVGLSLVSFDNSGLVQRDASNNEIGSFTDTRRALLFGWGVQPLRAFSFGFTHKVIRRELADFSSSGFDTDVGFSGRRGRYRAGLQVQNILGAELARDGGVDKLPRALHVGGAVAVFEPLLASLDIVTRAGVTDYRFGMEYSFLSNAAFRTGYDGIGPTFGASWQYKSTGIDYAMTQHSVLGLSHRVTLRAAWGAPAKEKMLARAVWRDELYAKIGGRIDGFKQRRAERREGTRKFAEYMKEGQRALAAGQHERAHTYGNMALHLDPKDKKARELAEGALMAGLSKEMRESGKPSGKPGADGRPLGGAELKELPNYRTSRKSAFGVVIGIERYRDIIHADYAARDARRVREYFERALGIPPENIVLRVDDRAALGDFKAYLEAWLKEKVTAGSEVFVYYSGHGTPEPTTGHGYLVPYDASPATIQQGGYSLSKLYEALGELPMKRGLVILDACFSGVGGPRTVLAKGTRPIVPVIEDPVLASGKIAVLSAASGTQMSGTFEEKQHGLMTYYLLRGLQGEADADQDKRISLIELYSYAWPKVVVRARESHREQEPKLLPAVDVGDPWKGESLAVLE
ncbi:MAG: PorV/PorQ family protein [Elusimicrobiota bacterium]